MDCYGNRKRSQISCDDIVAQYRVRNIPTVVFIKGGEVVDKVVGATSKDTLKSKIDALL
ncbi:MAG: thioredoxin family protein [Alistipes sp.]|nr:thioredoxin family protein [Alistipes sp.]